MFADTIVDATILEPRLCISLQPADSVTFAKLVLKPDIDGINWLRYMPGRAYECTLI
jgi:hypothetical protein